MPPFGPAADPLWHERSFKGDYTYAGYTSTVSLRFLSNPAKARKPLGIYKLVQLPPGGSMIIPTHSRTKPLIMFGNIPSRHLEAKDHVLRYTMAAPTTGKIAVRATNATGRIGYIHQGDRGEWDLVVRNCFVNPSGEYVDPPFDDSTDLGYSFQACNVAEPTIGYFNELDHHAPAVGADTGHCPRSRSHHSRRTHHRNRSAAGDRMCARVSARWVRTTPSCSVHTFFQKQNRSATKEIAETVVAASKSHSYKPVFSVWMGEDQVIEARDYLNNNGIPTFVSTEQAVRSFIYMYRYDNNLRLLLETPEVILKDFEPDEYRAEEIVRKVSEDKRLFLNFNEVKDMFLHFGLPVIPTKVVETDDEAVEIAILSATPLS